MAEIRCPMCGKDNPDHLEICQFCEARIKPLIAPNAEDDIFGFQDDAGSDESLPDWFDVGSGDLEGESDSAPFEDSADDWMTRLGGDSDSEEPSEFDPESDSPIDQSRAAARMDFNENGVPDWLDDLEQDRTTPPIDEVISPESADGDFPTWLSSDSDSGEDSIDDGGLPDWLVSSDEGDSLSEEPGAVGEDDTGLPSWLSADEDSDEPAFPDQFSEADGQIEAPLEETIPIEDVPPVFVADDEGELPDWLAGEEETQPAVPESEDDLPEWLTDDEEAEPATEGDLPEWLSDMEGTEVEPPEEAEVAIPTAEGDLPEWLTDMEGAEITPPEEVAPSIAADEAEAAEPAAEGDLPDWLAEMEGAEAATPEEAIPSFAAEEADLPDWLTGEEVEPAVPAAEGDLPEWLGDMEGAEAAVPEEAPPTFGAEEAEAAIPAAEGDLPEWLAEMEGAEAAVPEEAPPTFGAEEAEAAIPAAEGDLPEWLADMEGAEAAVPEEAIPSFAAEEADLPDWLAGEEEAEVAEPAAEGDLPEWLADIEGAEAAVPGAVAAAMEAEEADLPDWLAGEEEAETAVPAAPEEVTPSFAGEEAELPDWLAGEEEAEVAEPAAESDLPEWLADIEGAEAAIPGAVAAAMEAEEADLPDWLAGEEEAAEGDLPEWLGDMEGTEEQAADIVPVPGVVAADMAAEEADLPDWLAGEEEAETAEPAAEGDLPEWLGDMEGIEEPAEDIVPAAEGEIPAWLADMEDAEAEEAPVGQPDSAETDESRAVPDWLRDMEAPATAAALAGIASRDEDDEAEPVGVSPFTTDDEFDDDLFDIEELPAWISGDEQPQAETTQAPAEIAEGDLAPAELPGWLAAMRPVDSGASGVDEGQLSGPVESSGPLAGLYSVLAAEPEIARLKKPPVYSNKLNVTEAQQTNAALLQELLKSEGKPQALPSPSLVSGQRVFRTVLGVILVVVALLTVLSGSQMAALPTSGSMLEEANHISQLVNLLASQDTVLIAFDYEPGLAGEMEAAAAAMVDHMMLKGTKLALVSSSPTGPALAERFVNDVQSQHAYVNGTQYVNLGYIPGGVSGLAAFAQNPRWVTSNSLENNPAWDSEPLQNITNLADFAMVILLTDNPNTARGWVEQVHPNMGNVPLIAVVSAQVEPMVRPYRDTQEAQIAGLISGIPGGASYEVVSRANLARKYWDAFNIVLIVAVGAILIGGGITLVSDLLSRRKETGGTSE